VRYLSNKGQGKDIVLKAFRDSFSGTVASDGKGLISSALQTSSLGPLLQALDKITTDQGKREVGRRIYRARAKETDHANLRFFKGELSQRELETEQQHIIVRYATMLEKALGRPTVEAVDAEVARWAQEMMLRQITKPGLPR
jgi:hypothetical protein